MTVDACFIGRFVVFNLAGPGIPSSTPSLIAVLKKKDRALTGWRKKTMHSMSHRWSSHVITIGQKSRVHVYVNWLCKPEAGELQTSSNTSDPASTIRGSLLFGSYAMLPLGSGVLGSDDDGQCAGTKPLASAKSVLDMRSRVKRVCHLCRNIDMDKAQGQGNDLKGPFSPWPI